jgi:hypothetical protein
MAKSMIKSIEKSDRIRHRTLENMGYIENMGKVKIRHSFINLQEAIAKLLCVGAVIGVVHFHKF